MKQLAEKAFFLSYLSGASRYKWVDYLKGIAVLLVVYRHVLIGVERTGLAIPEYLEKANMMFYSFRMPLFFILSGLFISSGLEKKGLQPLLKTKTQTLLLPYLIWAGIQITLQIIFSAYTNSSRTVVDYTYLFYQPRNLDQFWYLPALFNVTWIYITIKHFLKPKAIWQLLLGLVLYFMSSYFNKISMMSDWMEFYIFFAFGDNIKDYVLKKENEKRFSSLWFLLAVTPFFAAAQFYYLYQGEAFFITSWRGKFEFLFIALGGCFTMFLAAQILQRLNTVSYLRVVGYHSLYIYVMHVLIAAPVRVLLIKVLHIYNPVILVASGIFISIIICISFYNLFIKNNWLWFLFPGDKRIRTI